MSNWLNTITKYLNKFLEVGVLLLAVSVIAELVFGPNVAFFGTQSVQYFHFKGKGTMWPPPPLFVILTTHPLEG